MGFWSTSDTRCLSVWHPCVGAQRCIGQLESHSSDVPYNAVHSWRAFDLLLPHVRKIEQLDCITDSKHHALSTLCAFIIDQTCSKQAVVVTLRSRSGVLHFEARSEWDAAPIWEECQLSQRSQPCQVWDFRCILFQHVSIHCQLQSTYFLSRSRARLAHAMEIEQSATGNLAGLTTNQRLTERHVRPNRHRLTRGCPTSRVVFIMIFHHQKMLTALLLQASLAKKSQHLQIIRPYPHS